MEQVPVGDGLQAANRLGFGEAARRSAPGALGSLIGEGTRVFILARSDGDSFSAGELPSPARACCHSAWLRGIAPAATRRIAGRGDLANEAISQLAPATLLGAAPPSAGDGHNQHRSGFGQARVPSRASVPGRPQRRVGTALPGLRHRPHLPARVLRPGCAAEHAAAHTKAEAKAKDRWKMECARSCGWTK